ncbi:hypothetical protein HPB52_018734 [Rhipicephalus sanguineus]|uniref:Uncharacterized protein n=1 Tax=Rhipicephalus sanguineus TaxID=34632 RepID=A0A9D4T7U3_RHISA|nr:hypothetical protein HPB52_018734 [Rhipicephalus sanguineus]
MMTEGSSPCLVQASSACVGKSGGGGGGGLASTLAPWIDARHTTPSHLAEHCANTKQTPRKRSLSADIL